MRFPLVTAALVCAALLVGCSSDADESDATIQGAPSTSSDPGASPTDESTSAVPSDPTPVQFRVVRASGNAEPDEVVLGDFQSQFEALDCAAAPTLREVPAPEVQLSCDAQQVRYLLEPASLETVVESAEVDTDESGNPLLTVALDSSASAELGRVTGRLADTDTKLAVVVNGFVVTAPVVAAPIEGGVLQIAGAFSEAEAAALVKQLTVGE